MMLQRLEEEHIRAYLQDEHTVTIDPFLSNAVGGIKLMVHEGQTGRALELLNGFEQVYRQSVVCPKCGSTNVHFTSSPKNTGSWLSAIATWLWSSFGQPEKHQYACFDCDHAFEELPEGRKENPAQRVKNTEENQQ